MTVRNHSPIWHSFEDYTCGSCCPASARAAPCTAPGLGGTQPGIRQQCIRSLSASGALRVCHCDSRVCHSVWAMVGA